MLIGMLLESFGLALLLPIVNFIIDPGKLNQYPTLVEFTTLIGIDDNFKLITFSMVTYSVILLHHSLTLLSQSQCVKGN